MTIFLVKGHEIESKITKSAYDRKVVLFANNIIDELKKIGITRDDIEIKTNVIGNKNVPAVIEFWSQGHYGRFSFSLTKRFVDNMYIIMEFVKLEVEEVLSRKKEMSEFFHTFESSGDRKEISKDLEQAKKVLGLSEDEKDLEIINKAYKKLAKEHHPDAGGDLEEFKKVNKAHKLIKKEMGL